MRDRLAFILHAVKEMKMLSVHCTLPGPVLPLWIRKIGANYTTYFRKAFWVLMLLQNTHASGCRERTYFNSWISCRWFKWNIPSRLFVWKLTHRPICWLPYYVDIHCLLFVIWFTNTSWLPKSIFLWHKTWPKYAFLYLVLWYISFLYE